MIRSLPDVPLSVASASDGAAADVVSSVKVSEPEAVPSLATMVCAPAPSSDGVKVHTPLPLAVAVPIVVPFSVSVIAAPGSDVPVSAAFDVIRSTALEPVSCTSATVTAGAEGPVVSTTPTYAEFLTVPSKPLMMMPSRPATSVVYCRVARWARTSASVPEMVIR